MTTHRHKVALIICVLDKQSIVLEVREEAGEGIVERSEAQRGRRNYKAAQVVAEGHLHGHFTMRLLHEEEYEKITLHERINRMTERAVQRTMTTSSE